MQKKFLDVFHTLKLNEYQKNLVENISVERIVKLKNNSLSVNVVSSVLVKKKDIAEIEKLMSIEYKIGIDIKERFELSSNYTVEKLVESCKEDIGHDLKSYGLLMYKLFTEAAFTFFDNGECIAKIPKLYAYEVRAEKFKSLFEKILLNKFGKTVILKFELVSIENISTATSSIPMDIIKTSRKDKKSNDNEPDFKIPKVEKQDKITEEKNVRKKSKSKFSRLIKEDLTIPEFKIADIGDIPGEYILDATIISFESRQIREGLQLITFVLTDFTDSISAKIFVSDEDYDEALSYLSKGKFIRIKGRCDIDSYEKEFMMSTISGIQIINNFKINRKDSAPIRRIELSAHTKMSKMEAVCDIGDIIKRANEWGHPALAISDFGVVHGFPNAMKEAKKFEGFKVIYGMTANMVDDDIKIVNSADDRSLDCEMVVFDIETTGFNAGFDKIIEIGAVKIKNGKVSDDYFHEFVNPERPLSYDIINLTKIVDDDLSSAETIDKVLPRFLDYIGDAVICAHNAAFDMSFINKNAADLNLNVGKTVLDTLTLSRRLIKGIKNYKLGTLAKKFNIKLENAHRANDDAKATAEVLVELLEMAKKQDINTLNEINTELGLTTDDIKLIYPNNVSMLIKNDVGRINLYTMVSLSHLEYFKVNAKIPKSMVRKYREGILIGTGNIDGELQQAILRGKRRYEIEKIMELYDYIEVQPPSHYIADSKQFTNIEDVYQFIKKIIDVGKRLNKPVVATGDVHFIDPEDNIYRKIVKYGDKKTLKFDAPLHFMTTDEMLKEFSFLDERTANEIVITNTHLINDQIENISPVRPDKCPPIIEDSDKELSRLCYEKAHEIYGSKLPDVVEARLKKELTSIIGNGFAVMYIIAQKLVKKSNDDGYMVGSRGSVGSSFAATMSGITEVNPLPPHYYCKNCHYSEFDSEVIRENVGLCGCDLPDKLCPVCGEKLCKEGFDIPFETFLGFKGNKEPDIDLNFSGEYQNRAHKETEVIFGKGQTFRAGTISGVAEKTAFGYAKGYLEEEGINKRRCEVNRLASGVEGVKKTTGQHPGGIIVLPKGENIYSFTPIQRPADDETSNIITTHFDYHSIDHNLLKLDILGHDDPTMIRRLEDLTGIDAKTIPFDEPKVMSIFHNPDALKITSEDILGCKVGCRGIPEFGTDFTINMVIDTKPKNFTDLLKISGLSHGTDVWVGNAQELINSGQATISECICTRDDIMTFLISKGLEQELAFTIMESVRKGKGLKPEWEEAIREHGIPEWYIWSCNKIKYMFPKAHAVAYVMMAYRIAYFKVYHPLEYYTAFFSIRASAFNYKLMCMGKNKLEYEIHKYKEKAALTKVEKDTLKDMMIVQEMYARGYEFAKIDLYKADDTKFQILDGKIMPSISVIDGLGEKAASLIVSEARKSKFISKDDLKKRCKLSNTAIELMTELGLLSDLPDTNQISIFDLM